MNINAVYDKQIIIKDINAVDDKQIIIRISMQLMMNKLL